MHLCYKVRPVDGAFAPGWITERIIAADRTGDAAMARGIAASVESRFDGGPRLRELGPFGVLGRFGIEIQPCALWEVDDDFDRLLPLGDPPRMEDCVAAVRQARRAPAKR